MPKVLRQEEATTLYPIKKIAEWMPFDPYHDYYVIRKEVHYAGSNVGLLKSIDDKTSNLYIIWLDSVFTQTIKAKDNISARKITDSYGFVHCLKESKETKEIKVDVKIFSLQKFIQLCSKADTNALDLLFSISRITDIERYMLKTGITGKRINR